MTFTIDLERVREATLPCGAQDWAYDDDGTAIIYGTCEKSKGHESRWHQEFRDGKLWAEWSGRRDSRAPCDTNS
jgi:hypothetical protein